MEKEKEQDKHDSPHHGNIVLSVTTLSGTNTGHFQTSDTLQEVIDWIVRKQHLVINGPMVLSYNEQVLNPASTIEQAGLPNHARLTYLAAVGGGGRVDI
ncbi:MAG: hypothetical protein ACR2H4_09795 [Pyrinomonadaceae bacterium]